MAPIRRSLRSMGTPTAGASGIGEPASDPTQNAKNQLLQLTNADEIIVQSGPVKKPRGRPARTLVSASNTTSTVSSPSRPDLSSDGEFSTPATSKVPTPQVAERSASDQASKSRSYIEVRLPSKPRAGWLAEDEEEEDVDHRALRDSIYSLKPARGRKSRSKRLIEVMDSEDDDDDSSQMGRDARAARRLQEEEFAKVDDILTPPNSLRRRSTRNILGETPSTVFSAVSTSRAKRGRETTQTTPQQAPPAKRNKAAQSSERPQPSVIDLDAEYAAGAAMVLENDMIVSRGTSEDEAELTDPDESTDSMNDESDDELAIFSEDEPLASRKASSKGKESARSKAITSQSAAQRSRNPADRAGSRANERRGKRKTRSSKVVGDSEEEEEDVDENASVISVMSWASNSSISAPLPSTSASEAEEAGAELQQVSAQRRAYRHGNKRRLKKERNRLENHHPEILTMWADLEKMPVLKAGMAPQPPTISRQLKPFQLEGLAWMKEMEKTEWRGGLLGDEMGLGKTIQAVSLIMSDYPAKQPSLVLVPPVALMQWQSEIKSYTDGTLKTFVFHGTNQKAKNITAKELKAFDVIMMSYNSLESMFRKQEKGFKRKNGIHKEKSVIHAIKFHRIVLDEAHCIKTRSTMTAKACFVLQTNYRWCLSGTPLQNRIGEFFSLIRFLNVRPFALYLCKQCSCSCLEWSMEDSRCSHCGHAGMQHVSVFNQELLNPIQKFGNLGPGREAFKKLRLMTDRIMLRRLKKDHTNSMELPVKEVFVDRQFFGEEENDFANSIMTNGQRKFDTYVAQGVLLNNYANIFGLIMQMRQVADHPDLLLKKNAEGGQNILVCCICDEPAEDTVRSRCKHDFCRACVSSYVHSTDTPDCPSCHIPLSIDLEQPEIEQDETLVKKNSIINRIKMENWTSSSKIELLVHELHKLRSDNASHKSIIFSQFTTMLQLIEWRLRRAGITTVMLDGSMTPAQRQASIEHFMNNVDVECFLVSLKAGGVALNLTEASRVFIVDPWWNPAAEWQSADRCHRIGQTRPCSISRLCIEDSVESRMVLIQEKKTNMIHSTINADDKAMESLSPEDMQFLFRGT